MLGVSYKPGVGDIRESPALKIIALLRELGAEVRYHDPHVPALTEFGLLERAARGGPRRTPTWPLIVTAHPSVDHDLVARRARLLLDLRGVTRTVERRKRRAPVRRPTCDGARAAVSGLRPGIPREGDRHGADREPLGADARARTFTSARASASARTWSCTTAP